jgi:hypothetical protein
MSRSDVPSPRCDAQGRDPFYASTPRKRWAAQESAPVLPVLSGRDQVTARRMGAYFSRHVVIFS